MKQKIITAICRTCNKEFTYEFKWRMRVCCGIWCIKKSLDYVYGKARRPA